MISVLVHFQYNTTLQTHTFTNETNQKHWHKSVYYKSSASQAFYTSRGNDLAENGKVLIIHTGKQINTWHWTIRILSFGPDPLGISLSSSTLPTHYKPILMKSCTNPRHPPPIQKDMKSHQNQHNRIRTDRNTSKDTTQSNRLTNRTCLLQIQTVQNSKCRNRGHKHGPFHVLDVNRSVWKREKPCSY